MSSSTIWIGVSASAKSTPFSKAFSSNAIRFEAQVSQLTMSSAAPQDAIASQAQAQASGSKKKKNKKNKPKKNLDTLDSSNDGAGTAGPEPSPRDGDSNNNQNNSNNLSAEDEPDTPVTESSDTRKENQKPPRSSSSSTTTATEPQANGHVRAPSGNSHPIPSDTPSAAPSSAKDPSAKLEAMSDEREALRTEVEQLRKQLETLQESHSSEITSLKSNLEETEAAREQAEEQYQTLLGRVEKIKETLGDRLKRDRAALEEANQRIEELEAQNEELQKGGSSSEEEVTRLRDELQESNRELTTLRSRSNLSQQNWLKEKDDMARQVQHFRNELESTSSAMGEWEAIAMEERQVRETLAEKAMDLEEQLASVREAYEKAAEERDGSLQTIDGLQRVLQEIQDARRKELRDLVESSEEQLQEMKKRVEEADKKAAEAEEAKERLSKELERTAPFEKEVREKNLLIGKLRHEGIILNDHLTKALRYLKKTKPDEQVDRQIITNYLLQFLSLDRSDPKRFQILQVIAGYLAWTEEQKEQAGLARPGASHNTLRLPASPFHRTPSTPSLHTDFFSEQTSTSGKESLADLWAGFLERSAEEGRQAEITGTDSRKGSVSSSTGTGITITKPDGGKG
ncbi:hypothetical protein VSDG_00828 [Cytospora chrysosperma]|uniref:GRIP domain-containing protein n=1 Tax=Cytospora chrysosperma TaxID=252740 RepID=A0A423WKN6_CYTCH|nr:hypothetical protein VSDG_00828 [Valsa sordida]